MTTASYNPVFYLPEAYAIPIISSVSSGYNYAYYIPTPAVPTGPSTWANHFVDVKDYGAVGDGVADDTAAIQAAINATVWSKTNGGKIVLLSGGTYKTTAPLIMVEGGSIAGVSPLRGHYSPFLSTINFYGGPTDNCIQAVGASGGASTSLSRCVIERFRIIDKRTAPTGGNGVYYEKVANQTVVRNMDIDGFPTGSSVRVDAQAGNVSDCVTIEDIWGLGSKYAVYVHNIDNTCFIRDIKIDTASTDPLVAGVHVVGLNGVCLISGVKHENSKAAAVTVELDTSFNGTLVDGIISRVGNGGAVVSIVNSVGGGVTVRGLQRQSSGPLLTVGTNTVTGTRLPFWVGGPDGINVNGARVIGQYDVWTRMVLEGSIQVSQAPPGGRVGFYGTGPIARPALTYSRATETAGITQLRAALTNLGLVTDSTVP